MEALFVWLGIGAVSFGALLVLCEKTGFGNFAEIWAPDSSRLRKAINSVVYVCGGPITAIVAAILFISFVDSSRR